MGIWKYRKPEPSDIRGLCVVCNKNKQKPKRDKFLPYCSPCEKKLYQKTFNKKPKYKIKIPTGIYSYRTYKKDECEECGFIPAHKCQLDVHHIDNNHKNNAPENLQTLCANCHRLKTYQERWGWPPRD